MENLKDPEAEKTDNLGEFRKLEKLNQIYSFILSKYKEYIENGEKLSVAELPTLIMPKVQLVVKKSNEIKEAYENYEYESDFSSASMKAYDFVKNDIQDVSLPLQFWFTPEETLKFLSGDLTDKSILLCSLLIALGNPSTKVLVAINGNERKIVVYYEFGGSVTMLDLDLGIKIFSNKDALLKSFDTTEDSIAYEFNDQVYIDLV